MTALTDLGGKLKVHEVSGLLRIIINPATGETKFAFVNSPDINYTLDGLIGIGLETIRENIDNTIEETIVLPNTLTFQFNPPTSPVQETGTKTTKISSSPVDGVTLNGPKHDTRTHNEIKNDDDYKWYLIGIIAELIRSPPDNEYKWHILGIIAGFIWSKTDVSMIIYLVLVAIVVFNHVNNIRSSLAATWNRKTIQKHEIHSIHARLDDSNPPSWASFPDWERCEWMNKIIKHLWGRGCDYTSSYVRYLIESYVSENIQLDFKLGSYNLGYVVSTVLSL